MLRHMLSISLAFVLLAACTSAQQPATPPAQACAIVGEWNNEVAELGTSVWTISADGVAREQGIGNASGSASVQGHLLRINFTTGGYEGFYEITLDSGCRSGQGRATWTRTPPGVEPRSFSVTLTRR